MAETFGVSRVFQLAPEEGAILRAEPSAPMHLRGRILFSTAMSYSEIEERVSAGWSIKSRVYRRGSSSIEAIPNMSCMSRMTVSA